MLIYKVKYACIYVLSLLLPGYYLSSVVCDGDLRDREKLRDFMAVVDWIGGWMGEVDGRGGLWIVDCGHWTWTWMDS